MKVKELAERKQKRLSAILNILRNHEEGLTTDDIIYIARTHLEYPELETVKKETLRKYLNELAENNMVRKRWNGRWVYYYNWERINNNIGG
jgi:predicted transcriptional regulator